jgi:hypothetical protein
MKHFIIVAPRNPKPCGLHGPPPRLTARCLTIHFDPYASPITIDICVHKRPCGHKACCTHK